MTEEDILNLSKKKFASWQYTDVNVFSRIFDERGLIFKEKDNAITKNQMIAQMESKECTFEEIDLKNTMVRVFGTSAVVHGEGDFTIIKSGKTSAVHLNFLDVWVERENGWQLVSSHYATPISAE
ncbi:nuclear transport factor 2 family protein [Algoriphagus sediminis]|uniref:Nuclear transport factor 2 family protein n=1 Tax=Algoriphagus sediminis TaxID=3057113 RepID=A0ABT7YC45_9BACT|nr:nuclear transport factor 2 family protein [Algoriphagus sediminis]MDN3204084.1 nuclear transport factor 2 family protein [Algoriphagus sediminis]